MRSFLLCTLIVACGGHRPPTVALIGVRAGDVAPITHTQNFPPPLAAGACMFNGVFAACPSETPRFAVVLSEVSTELAATAALHRARSLSLPAGYPFAITYDDLPAVDATKRHLVAVVAGLFVTDVDANRYARLIGASVVPLLSVADNRARLAAAEREDDTTAIEVSEAAPALSADDVARLEAAAPQQELRERLPWMGSHAPERAACHVARGQVFVFLKADAVSHYRTWAPVRCPSGATAWVLTRATRWESVVIGTMISQVVSFEECSPVVETRRFVTPAEATLGRLEDVYEDCD